MTDDGRREIFVQFEINTDDHEQEGNSDNRSIGPGVTASRDQDKKQKKIKKQHTANYCFLKAPLSAL